MKTNRQMMEDLTENALTLFKTAQKHYLKNPKDKDWQRLYLAAQKGYIKAVESLKNFK